MNLTIGNFCDGLFCWNMDLLSIFIGFAIGFTVGVILHLLERRKKAVGK